MKKKTKVTSAPQEGRQSEEGRKTVHYRPLSKKGKRFLMSRKETTGGGKADHRKLDLASAYGFRGNILLQADKKGGEVSEGKEKPLLFERK